MKILHAIIAASSFLVVAGCSTEQHQAKYSDTMAPTYSSGRLRDFNEHEVIANVAAGKSGTQSDNAIVAAVREALQTDAEIAPLTRTIQVNANNGAVLLNGSVQSEEQKRQIESLAQKANGVVAVNNQLQVSASPLGLDSNQPGDVLLKATSTRGTNLPRIYKDSADGMDFSTNSVLNPPPLPDVGDKLYQQKAPGDEGDTTPLN